MKKTLPILFVGGAFLVRLIAACSSDDTATVVTPDGGTPVFDGGTTPIDDAGVTVDSGPVPTAERGDYLVNHVLLCTSCHAQPGDAGVPFGGGRAFAITVDGGDGGFVYAANLTPSDQGLGSWSNDQIVQAIRTGIDDQGDPLHPTMPYSIYGNLTTEDATSIALYLKSLAPSANSVPERTVDVTAPAPRLSDTGIPHTTLPSTDPSFASAERGRYIAELACIDCHTTRTPAGSPDLAHAFAGGRAFGPTRKSSNLTPDPTGLGTWSAAQIADTLKTGNRQGTGSPLCSPMPTGPTTYGGMTDGDRGDIGAFLHTLTPATNGPFESDGGVCN